MNNISKEELQNYYDTHSNIETASYLGVSRTQMMRIVNKWGIKKKSKPSPHRPITETVNELLDKIDSETFKKDCMTLMQKELVAKYHITIRQINYLKKYLNIGNRLTYCDDYKLDPVEFADYYKQHTLQETADKFNISNPTTVKNLLRYYGIPIEKRFKETVEEAAQRIDKKELQAFYLNHTIQETETKFDTKNLRNLLIYFNINGKTKARESFESAVARIDKDTFSADYNTLPVAELFAKYDIAYTLFRKLVKFYDLGPKPGVFAFSDASFSHCEDDLANYIASLIGSDAILRNDRTVLKGKEIDIYIPAYKIGIEFNGVYWHSDLRKEKNYHFNKSIEAEQAGVHLIHVWEYEWQDPIIKNKLKQFFNILFNKNITKIYARQCEVRKISNAEAKDFNNKTHLQGHRNAQVTYGLFYKDKLVQLMSFSRTRYNKNLKSDDEWEIIRGCPGSNNIVVGGVSKLFKHFVDDYKPKSVFSYCDFNKFNGRSYETIGMKFIGYTGPDLKYVLDDGQVVPRSPKNYKYNNTHCIYRLFGAGSKKYRIVFKSNN